MTRQGAFKFLQQFMKNRTIAKQPGCGTEEVKLIVVDQMRLDGGTILSIAWLLKDKAIFFHSRAYSFAGPV